ncbi:hypothetical protein ES703_36792 [subsurface metagenome]
MKKFYPITISPTDNGIIVEAGCLKIVYQQTQLGMFIDDLNLYFADPGEGYKQIRKRWGITPEDQPEEVAPTIPEEERTKEPEAKRAY